MLSKFVEMSNKTDISRYKSLPGPPSETIFRLYMIENPTPYNVYSSALNLLKFQPLPFQLLHCTSLTTAEIVSLFFSQMKENESYSYVIVGVNRLSNEIQEVQHLLKLSIVDVIFLL